MLSANLESYLNQAAQVAKEKKHEYVSLEHILLIILDDKDVREILEACAVNLKTLKNQLEKHLDQFSPKLKSLNARGPDEDGFSDNLPEPVHHDSNWRPEFTLACHRLLQRAMIQVQSAGKDQVECKHVLVSIMSEKESHAVFFLEQQGLTQFDLINYIAHGVSKTAFGENDNLEIDGLPKDSSKTEEPGAQTAAVNPLEAYTQNLNEKARAGKVDPLIGREDVLERTVQILCRRTKNNPLLIGEPGVGKTAIADGLALRIVRGEVPEILKTAVVYSLDMGSLLAGTKFRGDFEERMKAVVKAVKSEPHGVLFIDEIHTLVGAGATSGGSMDASNLLKPALANGELSCIGSTTYKEYRQFFEKDRALSRRFQKIDVREPTIDETVQILEGLKSRYEEHHHVKYSAASIKAAADLAARYIQNRHLPDKAIDVLDETGARLRIQASLLSPSASSSQKSNSSEPRLVKVSDVEKVVASMAQVPMQSVSVSDRNQLRELEKNLRATVFGQDAAIHALATSIKLSRTGLGRDNKPVGSYLFAGPTGVGKTEVCKQLAKILGNTFLRFDMSEYMEKHSVARLVGAPPGYVGFEEGGLLTEAVTKNPYAVLLLDEIEKAHPDIYNILLQVMDNGTLTDSHGKAADFRNVILVMTSNAGASDAAKQSLGIHEKPTSYVSMDAIKRTFTPEFINRLDSIIHFQALNEEMMMQVVGKFVSELAAQLAKKKIHLTVTPEAERWLMQKGFNPAYGARPLGRTIDEHIKKPLADEILFGRLERGGSVQVSVDLGSVDLGSDSGMNSGLETGAQKQNQKTKLRFEFS